MERARRRTAPPDDRPALDWEAIAEGGERFAVGLCFLILAEDGRVQPDYTFVVG
ncbi:MAG TPA: hypothetical protein VIZ61_00625 [Solirubrobacterales bacterium]